MISSYPIRYAFLVLAIFATAASAADYARPEVIKPDALAGNEALEPNRRKLVANALTVAENSGWLKYQFGSADPKKGGFDCSGAMYYVLRNSGLEPRRTSAGQYLWIKEFGNLHVVEPTVNALDDKVFVDLKPGDLLFWTGTYKPTDGRKVPITHVSMYLGRAKEDGRMLMIGSSKGRSYRGKRQDGYGVYDFKLPSTKSKSKFVGYGTPPGLGG